MIIAPILLHNDVHTQQIRNPQEVHSLDRLAAFLIERLVALP